MSYDVVVWEGEPPANDSEAVRTFEALSAQYEEAEEPPTERVLRFVAALTAKFPDLTELPDDEVDDSPWAAGPLIDEARGSFVYLALTYSAAEDTLPFVVETAGSYGLVCFDPQEERLLH